MKARATTHLGVHRDAAIKRIPMRFRDCIDVRLLDDVVDLLIFPPDERYVVSSKDLRKALESRPESPAQLVAVAVDFTSEARELIDSLGGLFFSEQSFFGWTDEQWHVINQ